MWDCVAASSETMETIPTFVAVCGLIAACMLIWDTVEVGRNDAANLINAVFGARILTRQAAIWVAGLGAVLGAASASPASASKPAKIKWTIPLEGKFSQRCSRI